MILANLFMDIFNFVLDPSSDRLGNITVDPTIDLPLAAPPAQVRGQYRVPGWLLLLLQNRKSRIGAVHGRLRDPHRDHRAVDLGRSTRWIFNLFDARQAPSWNRLFRTTDQGGDIFSQVVMGARRSLLLGLLAGAASDRPRRDPRHRRRLHRRAVRRGASTY